MNTELLECGHPESPHSDFTRGYGTDANGDRLCYDCCAKQDRQQMIDGGRITLYLVPNDDQKPDQWAKWWITNWPGSLRFPVGYVRKGGHNIARNRYDCWFDGPDGHVWHGVQYGDNTQICHCKRTKETTK